MLLKLSPVLGICLPGLLLLSLIVGGTEVLGDIGGLVFGEVCISAIALRLTTSRVESSRFLYVFFYIESRPSV